MPYTCFMVLLCGLQHSEINKHEILVFYQCENELSVMLLYWVVFLFMKLLCASRTLSKPFEG